MTKSLTDERGDVAGVLACISDVTETELIGRDLERRATFDALTGCLNRATALARLEALLSTGDAGCAVIFLDLDDFKSANDRSGHAVGDELLRAAVRVLESTTRPGDVIGRFGGDEFLVVCGNVGTPDDALRLARRISDGFSRHPPVLGSQVPLRASIGVAWARAGSVSSDELVERADAAMYASKRSAAAEPHLFDASGRDPRSA
jgi:diguanylate cyclase (GGDEF)-like protein